MNKEIKEHIHTFFYLKDGRERAASIREYSCLEPDAIIQDDIFERFYDTLLWIPCAHLNFHTEPKELPVQSYGLNQYGITYINAQGGEIFSQVMDAWANLLVLGASEFELTGQIQFKAVKGNPRYFRTTGFMKIVVDRDWIVGNLRTLAEFGRQIVGTDDQILHIGA